MPRFSRERGSEAARGRSGGVAINTLQEQELPIGLVLCGLPSLSSNLLRARTYTERMFRGEQIGALSRSDAADALLRPAEGTSIAIDQDVVDRVVAEVEGYPFFIQLWGAELWEAARDATLTKITPALLDAVESEIYRRLDADFYDNRVDVLTPAEQDLLMATPATGTRTCKFPGCRRPVEQATGAPGRPSEYCDDAEHTAVRAWRARRAGTSAPAGEPDDMGRPVAMATARAGMLRDDMVKTAEQLSEQLSRAIEEMRTLTDPDAAAAQVETVAAEAAQQVAAADVARNRAEAATREAKSELAEANDAAQELEDQLQQANAARAESDRLRQEAVDELAAATATVQALTADLTARTGERDQLQRRVEEQTRELTSTREQLLAETRRADDVTARADRERASAEKSLGQMETRLADSTTRAGELDRQLTGTRNELDTAHAAQARLEAQLAAATRRADEANARTNRADTARVDAERERAAAEKAATRLEAQLEQARTRVEELSADRDRLTTNLTEAMRTRGEAPATPPTEPGAAKTSKPRARKSVQPSTPPA